MKQLSLLFIFFAIVCLNAKSQQGSLDPTFGSNGIVNTSFPGENTVYFTQAIQQDDKVVVAAQFYDVPVTSNVIKLVRYLPDGSIDASFGDNGRSVPINFGVSSLATQEDGKIIAAGGALVRLMPNGTIDSSFGINGTVIIKVGGYGSYSQSAKDVILQQDGKILITGSYIADAQFKIDVYVARYNPDGSLDESFGESGKAIVPGGVTSETIVLQRDGKIVIGGSDETGGRNQRGRFFLSRLKVNGDLDSSFDENGLVFTDFDKDGEYIYEIVLQQDGKIVAAGSAGQPGWEGVIPYMAVARYNTDGSLDQSFGEGGKASIKFNAYSQANAVALQQNGKIVITGYKSYTDGNYVIARLLENGTLDPAFGNNGITITDIGTTADQAKDIDIQRDGRIIVGGSPNITLAGYTGDPVENPVIAHLKTWLRNNTLGWYTSNNSSVNYYSIQRSISGSSFKEEKRVQANNSPRLLQQANTREQQTFTYALNTVTTNSYYRVAAVLNDGSTAFSPVVYYGSGKHITLYPNPVKEVLTVNGLQPQVNNLLTITDVGGNVLLSATVTSSETFNYNVSRLKAGQYVLRVQSTEQVQTLRFVKE